MADAECSLPGAVLLMEIRAELHRFTNAPALSLNERLRAVSDWSSTQARRHAHLVAQVEAGARRELLVRRTVLGCAPLASLSGAWLQWLTSPGTAGDPISSRILALYAADLSVGRPHASRGSVYLALLRHFGLSEYATPAARLTLDHRIADSAFVLPALLLAMSRCPDDFRLEILGADLCLRRVGLLPALTVVRGEAPSAVDWDAIDAGAARKHGLPTSLDHCRCVVDTLLAEHPGHADRVALGFGWAMETLRQADDDLCAELEASRDPAFEMAELVRRRAGDGTAYYHSVQLGGRPLASWLAQSHTEPRPFLAALAESRLVTPGRADRSPLVNGLVLDRGPLFGVFAAEDLAVIRRWIDSLPARGNAVPTPNRSPRLPELALPSLTTEVPDAGRAPASLRAAYHQLLRRTDSPALRHYTVRYVRRWLDRSARHLDPGAVPLPVRWPADGLRPWLAAQRDRRARELDVRATVQLAPLVLINGAWLQGFTDYEYAATDIGYRLFATYWDELGAGESERDYRQVLSGLGVLLPPTGSMEFAFWPGFLDEPFALAVYWLCVGRLPRTFMPEVLGLNLAIELSGLADGYRRDHSAWAADAIDTYLSALPPSSESGIRAAAWTRIRTGYRSLQPPRRLLARGARLLKDRFTTRAVAARRH